VEMVEFEVKLPKRRVEELKASAKLLEDVEREIERAREAGLDVSELEAKAMEVRESIEKLLRVYAKE